MILQFLIRDMMTGKSQEKEGGIYEIPDFRSRTGGAVICKLYL